MRMNKFLAILNARNKEFFRDKASLSWNIMFPILLLIGFAFIFSGGGKALYKVGLIEHSKNQQLVNQEPNINESSFNSLKHIERVTYHNIEQAVMKVDQHKIDLLIDYAGKRYWVNETSAKGYIVEQLLLANHNNMQRSPTSGKAIRYVDWVMPGILGMNMMFSCLFGVGYVIVRYRKNGVLKRFQATPLTAIEFLAAQIVSRLFIVLCVTGSLFIGSNFLLDFYILGSILDLTIVAILGATSMIALSLMIASRSQSEEFTGGMLNFVSWPMMMLSGVWFSLEGAHPALQSFAQIFPLTHILDAARAIMTDGASLSDISHHLFWLALMSGLFLVVGSWLFNWGGERT
jgi:ABC-2 type transport system permease protein